MIEENSAPIKVTGPARNRSKVLIVDDEEINLKLLRVSLRAQYEIVEAGNGREALQKVEKENPDIVLLDIMLPDIDGFAVCERIRSDPKRQGLPVLMLTALKDLEDRVRAL